MRPSYKMFTTARAPGTIVDGVALSGAGTTYSARMSPDDEANIGFQILTDGTLAGTLTIWYSDEDQPTEGADTEWYQDTTWAPTPIAGAPTNQKYVITGIRARWVRVKFVYSGGSGTLKGSWN